MVSSNLNLRRRRAKRLIESHTQRIGRRIRGASKELGIMFLRGGRNYADRPL
jgi:hypothetical protein